MTSLLRIFFLETPPDLEKVDVQTNKTPDLKKVDVCTLFPHKSQVRILLKRSRKIFQTPPDLKKVDVQTKIVVTSRSPFKIHDVTLALSKTAILVLALSCKIKPRTARFSQRYKILLLILLRCMSFVEFVTDQTVHANKQTELRQTRPHRNPNTWIFVD